VGAPSAVAIRPDSTSLQPGDEADFAAALSGGFPFGQPAVSWSVEPRELGVIDARGHFKASNRSGSGKITAVAGGLSASANVTVVCPTSRSINEVTFKVLCNRSADVYAEALSDSDTGRVADVVIADVAALENDFGRTFGVRALVYVFANDTSYISGVRGILGERAAVAAAQTDAFFAPWADAIAINWRGVTKDLPVTALRHELTHRLVWKITGSPAAVNIDGIQKERLKEVPTWLDEGLAMVEEETVRGASWMAERDRTFGWAAYQFGDLPLSDLIDLGKWNRRTGAKAFYQYVLAAEAVRILSIRMGLRGVVRILERVRAGDTFAQAYLVVSGFPYEYFIGEYENLVGQGASKLPGMATAPHPRGTALLIYGYTRGDSMTLSFRGPTESMRRVQMDEYGNLLLVLGPEFPPGTYTVTAMYGRGPDRSYTITK
jgi:hypothetical protein